MTQVEQTGRLVAENFTAIDDFTDETEMIVAT
jgi:hypothetical protein